MQVTYFLIGPVFTLLLCYHFVLYWEKVTSYDKVNHKSKLYGKFQRFSAIDGTIELLKMVEYPKMPTKIKICKTFYKGQTASHRSEKSFCLSKPDKFLPRLRNKHFLTEMYRKIQTFAFKVLQEFSSWALRNGAVQMFFLTPNRKMLAGKFVKWERFLAALWEYIIFSVKWVEVVKMSEVFWAKLYWKMSDRFSQFLFDLRLFARKSKK